ncbi:hypothetical protein HMPREF3038_01501 [Akkermansia sp. KLE1797]|nr:hypothetical protein HMPREF3038_01501 [Akkermansia sp. KLE1797]KXU53468.1 hypothetical protein HMPREF3039_02374 [Akkermansia sp. KLE1798]
MEGGIRAVFYSRRGGTAEAGQRTERTMAINRRDCFLLRDERTGAREQKTEEGT